MWKEQGCRGSVMCNGRETTRSYVQKPLPAVSISAHAFPKGTLSHPSKVTLQNGHAYSLGEEFWASFWRRSLGSDSGLRLAQGSSLQLASSCTGASRCLRVVGRVLVRLHPLGQCPVAHGSGDFGWHGAGCLGMESAELGLPSGRSKKLIHPVCSYRRIDAAGTTARRITGSPCQHCQPAH